jgi:LGFP repeat
MGLPDGRGRARDFNNATIVWSPQTGAHEVHGDIRVKWVTNGWLGYPLTDETGTPDSVHRYNPFENGSIYWTADLGPHVVHGAIRDLWAAQGWERGCGRLPEGDEFNDPSTPGGRQSHVQRGHPLEPCRRGIVPPRRPHRLTANGSGTVACEGDLMAMAQTHVASTTPVGATPLPDSATFRFWAPGLSGSSS